MNHDQVAAQLTPDKLRTVILDLASRQPADTRKIVSLTPLVCFERE